MIAEGQSLHPLFKTISGKNYMEFVSTETDLISYQLEMIAHNTIEGLLSCEVLRIDGRVHIAYDITSLIPLVKLFERKVFTRAEFLSLIGQITALLKVLNEYLLDSGGVLFDSRYIYVNPQNLKLQLAYLPKKDMPATLEPLKNMLLDTIIHQVRFANEKTDNFIQKLIELLKEQELTLATLQQYHKQMETGEITFSMPSAYVEEARGEMPAPTEKQEKTRIEAAIPKPAPPQSAPQKTYETRMGYPSKSYYIMGSIILLLLIFGIVLVVNKTLSPDNPDFMLSLFGFLMVGGAVAYLAYTKLFSSDKKVELKVEKKISTVTPTSKQGEQSSLPIRQPAKRNSLYIPNQRIIPEPLDEARQERKEPGAYVNKAFDIPQHLQARNEAAAISQSIPQRIEPSHSAVRDSDRGRDRTVLLDASILKYPTLQRVRGGESLVIPLTHFPFMIGRLSGQVDYCLTNPAIGKMHVELKKTEEGIFVTDMNSRNGTRINEERLEPSREYKLEHGVRLTLANEEFIFNCTEE